ncbi:MAG: hypothetical protein PHT07_10880 [Paludibacter sp.]|nr:hypothetical protein [Paludibacter sp.]
MEWIKKGLIFNLDGESYWAKNTVLTPTPLLISDKIIRIYASFRDEIGRGRIGYIDVDAENPSIILKVSSKPVLDLGKEGTFDDNGMLLGDLLRDGDQIKMYYIGFQLVNNVKFLAYSGLAISYDNGESFKRYQDTPIMDRTQNAIYIRAIHSIMKENDIYKIWYSVGNGWEIIDEKPYPQYDIRYTESKDGIHFDDNTGIHCIGVQGNEYRIGRPRVIKNHELYEMRYTFDTKDKEYISGYAISENGIDWIRKDESAGLFKSDNGWDSEMLCYPVEIETNFGKYIFYSGNGMGFTGVGYAVLK